MLIFKQSIFCKPSVRTLRILSTLCLMLCFILGHLSLTCQSTSAKTIPKLNMLYPLQSPPSVSSSFGTYRINHHHSGIDLYAFEGTPVIAAADGTLSIIKQGSGGYGRAIYLKHKGGFTTLYAHLSAFVPSIQKLIDQKQKRKKSFSQKIRPREHIEFKAGEVLGWSGTSGTDLCHLHFELRYKNAPLNPLTHGLNLPDHQAPTLITLYADPLDEKARIEGALLPKRYEFQPRPNYPQPLASSLFTSSKAPAEKKAEQTVKETPNQTNIRQAETNTQEPMIEIWGNVGLSLEVEDRIDGSLRELTPHQIKLFVDDKLLHHLQYDMTSYADKRSTELDYDIARRGPERHLVHRLYRYGPRLRVLKKGSTRPLKRLKAGMHKAKVEAIDAAGNTSTQVFTLKVVNPKHRQTAQQIPKTESQENAKTTLSESSIENAQPMPTACRLKRKRLPKRKPIVPLWQPEIPNALEVSWRPYGLSFKLPKACDEEIPLEVDLRLNGKRASRHMLSLSHTRNGNYINLHFNRLNFDKESKVLAEQEAKKLKQRIKKKLKKLTKAKSKNKADHKDEKIDRSVEILIGLRGLLEPEQITQARIEHESEHESETESPRGSSPEDRGLKSIYWYRLRLHEVKNEAYFKADALEVEVGENSVFKPYVTAVARLPKSTKKQEIARNQTFAQAWLPMQKANEVKLKRPRLPRKNLGAYLVDGEQSWWVTSAWEDKTLSASSTHLATFTIAQDQTPPSIGQPLWDLRPHIGPRLLIPMTDESSGLSKVKLYIDGEEALIEVQRSWSRLVWKPSQALKAGKHQYTLSVKDRVGHHSEQKGELIWPPSAEQSIATDDPRWLLLEPK